MPIECSENESLWNSFRIRPGPVWRVDPGPGRSGAGTEPG